jgi:hypothetical protein
MEDGERMENKILQKMKNKIIARERERDHELWYQRVGDKECRERGAADWSKKEMLRTEDGDVTISED